MDTSPEEAALARIAPIISHEIRNPLAVMGNSAYFIKTKLGSAEGADPKVLKHLGIIESEIRRANDVIGEILGYARMPAAAPGAQRLNGLVQEGARGLEPAAPASLKLELSAKDPKVLADGELTKQCIRHLVRNAVEALAPGPTTPAEPVITVVTGTAGSEAFVEVSDNGPGLPDEAVKSLFTPFNTTKPRGVGLGLAYARKALERQKGRIERLESEKGCRFRVTLPLA
jgi:two-component system, NtrC family, sensor kinase